MSNDWIKVSDRLPEENTLVEIYCGRALGDLGRLFAKMSLTGDIWDDGHCWYDWDQDQLWVKATHWRVMTKAPDE